MATMPAFWRKAEETEAPRLVRDPYLLRALPQEDVFFYSKKIDNSRLEREADPKARGACWSAIGAACLALVLLTSVLAPSAATTLAGYKLESLRAEERRLLNERRVLELQQAELLSPARLEKLASTQNLVTPASGQTVHLDPKVDGKLALNGGQEPAVRGR
jgi:cell division protein FtsL